MTPYLIDVYKNGGSLGAFKSVYKEYEKAGKLPKADDFALNELSTEAELPWDFIEYPKNKENLVQEYKKI